MDAATGYCEGCYRTIEEIADWGMMAEDRKRSVWQALRRRRAELNPVAPTVAPSVRRPGETEPPFIGQETPPEAS